MSNKPRRRRQAFTLVELLVVLGIIMVLISILLPAIRNAQEQARNIKCLSNLRQLGQAAMNYSANFSGSYPISRNGFTIEWDFDSSGTTLVPGLLWFGSTNMAIQQCPAFFGKSPTVSDPYTGYNYNTSYIGGGAFETTPLGTPHYMPAKFSSVRHPSLIALFGDGGYGQLTNKYMRAPILMSGTTIGDGVSLNTRTAGTQGYRHLGKTNVCYCDGHAESVSARFTATGTNVGGVVTYSTSAVASAETGFLSVDNSAYDGHN